MPDNVPPQYTIAAKAARAQAEKGPPRRPQPSTACNILLDFGGGKGDAVMIYMSPDPCFGAFEQPLDLCKFILCKHTTAGLDLYEPGGRVHLTKISPSTPAANIPD
jgi:hypothetical protein